MEVLWPSVRCLATRPASRRAGARALPLSCAATWRGVGDPRGEHRLLRGRHGGGILERHPNVDAIIGASDGIPRAALDILRDHGKSVPEDVAVVGYDNWSIIVANTRPELTSIDMDLQTLGREAASRLFSALSGGEMGSGVELLPVKLFVRESTVGDFRQCSTDACQTQSCASREISWAAALTHIASIAPWPVRASRPIQISHRREYRFSGH
jgi:LacI family transcriptional regulator